MKILGLGVDIVENKRINLLIRNKVFISKVFNTLEIKESKKIRNKTSFYSKRFAAKESFAKAMGTGIRNNLNFKDIIISNDIFGKPFYMINSKIKKIILQKFKVRSFDLFLSISDEKKYSIAFTILQKK